MSDFVHLHCHTDYSLLDGATKIEGLVEKAHQCEMRAVAITDHGNMFGAIEFYKKCKNSGVKPLVGMEGYISVDSRFDRSREGNAIKYHHLILLAKDREGYHNLMKLSSIGYLEGFYYRPRFDKEMLEKHSKGLIVTSACLQGEVAYHLARGNNKVAEKAIKWYRELFGDDYYLEIQDHGIPEQDKANKEIIKLAKKYDVKVVATNDLHYLNHDDHFAHDVLLCVGTGSNLHDTKRFKFDSENFYLKTQHEMKALFKKYDFALANTIEVAEKCDLEIDFSKRYLPHFDPPTGEDPSKYFKRLCKDGLKERYSEITQEIKDRLNYETKIIEQMGFVSYFLIVQDFVQYAKNNDIPVGPGRGSAAGSLVAYTLGITDVDPLKYDLLFERFLNSERISMPDIDIDFSNEGRDEVIRYVTEKYGKDHVAQIITFGTLAARGVIRDVGRVLEIPLKEIDKIAKMIPGRPGITLGKAMAEEPELKKCYDQGEEQIKKLFDIAMRLEGMSRHASTHAAGVVIGSRPLMEIVPLYKAGDEISTQYTMTVLEELGLLKMDFLGLKNLSIISRCVKMVDQVQGIKVDPLKIPFDDKKTYELLSRGETKGVFQLESSGMRDVLVRLKPDCFDDVIALLALYRPGPLGSGMVDAYIRRKHGEEALSYPHQLLEPILKETNGVILYQEQVMRIANQFACFSLNEADNLRKAMGKKKPEVMAKFKKKFVEGAKENGVEEKTSTHVFELIEYFAGYGFNKCLAGSTGIIHAETGELTTIQDLFENRRPFKIHALGDDYKLHIRKVEDVVWNGKKRVYHLRTAQGKSIKATENHRFRTLDGWKTLGELKAGDSIASPRKMEIKTTKSWPRHKIIALASLLAEGNTCHPTCLYFFSNSEIMIEDFVQAAEQFPNTVARVSNRGRRIEVCTSTGRDMRFKPGQTATKIPKLGVIRSGLYKWSKEKGILGQKASDKSVPLEVFELCDQDIALFLGRLWSGDGFISNKTNHTPYYATSSERLARDVQTLLLRLGIMSGIHEKQFRYRGGQRKGYTVHLIGEGSISQFVQILGPHCIDRHKSLQRLREYIKSTDRDRASNTIPVAVKQWVDEERRKAGLTWRDLEARSGVSIRMLCLKDSSTESGFRRSTIGRLAQFFPSERLKNIANSDVFWDRLVSMEACEVEDTYDLTVEKDHSFIADGLIVHNSHSTAYAFVTYQTAYLKANYPIEYMAALLTCDMGNTDKVVDYMDGCRQMGIEVVPPDIHTSEGEFIVKNGRIHYGLNAIKGVGQKAVDSIAENREKIGKFHSLFHLCENIDLRVTNKGVMESLIKAGALDSLGAKRSQMVEVLDQALKMGSKHQNDMKSGQISLFGEVAAVAGSSGETHLFPDIEEYSPKEKLAYEKETLGFYLSGHPTTKYRKVLDQYCSAPLGEIKDLPADRIIIIGGMVSQVKKIRDKRNNPMAFLTIEDNDATMEGVIFASVYEKVVPYLVQDEVIFIRGKLSFKNELPSIMVDEILPPEKITANWAESLTISLEVYNITSPDLLELREVILRHAGVYPLYLRFHSAEGLVGTVKGARHFQVNVNPRLIADLEALNFVKGLVFNKEWKGKVMHFTEGELAQFGV